MKKCLLLIALLYVAFYTHAQVGGIYLRSQSSYLYSYTAGTQVMNDTVFCKYNAGNPRQYLPELDKWSVDTMKAYQVNNVGVCILKARTYYTYDTQFQPTLEFFDFVNGSVITPSERIARTFNTAGKVLTRESQDSQGPLGLVNSLRSTNTYTANGKISSVITEIWNASLNQYENASTIIYTYDVNDLLITEDVKSYTGTAWVDKKRIDYTYVGGNMTEKLSLNHDGSSYVNAELKQYTYDANGNAIGIETKEWGGSGWNNAIIETMTYDANNNLASHEKISWNGSAYMPVERHEFTYVQDKMASVMLKVWDGSAYSSMVPLARSAYYYYDVATSVPQAAATQQAVSIYPNPSGSYINLDAGTTAQYSVVLTDMAGKVVKTYSGDSQSNNRLDVEDVPAGNYLLQVHAGGNVSVEKLVIAR